MNLFVCCPGDFGKEVLDCARRINESKNRWDKIYFTNETCFIDSSCIGKEIYGAKLFTLDTVTEEYDLNSFEVSIAIGEPLVRKEIYHKLKSNDVKLATLVDNTAIISDTAKLGDGVIILAYCCVSSLAILGNNTVLNFYALIGHDVTLKENCVVSAAVNIGGNCSVGENSFIGMGAQIMQGVTIGKDVIVGIGSVVYNDIPDGVIVLGNPARPMRHNIDKKVFRKLR
jgi:sugar O-acyltransferase (sialic acid O-acetyltransferase NeuD family)